MRVAREEIFGPVLSVIRVDDLEAALAIGRECPYGNGASIFTRSGWAARQFKQHFNAGMIGINIGVPAPMAWFPFTGWNSSFFGDLHIQGTESIQFYTQQKMTMTRWFESPGDSPQDPVWKGNRDELYVAAYFVQQGKHRPGHLVSGSDPSLFLLRCWRGHQLRDRVEDNPELRVVFLFRNVEFAGQFFVRGQLCRIAQMVLWAGLSTFDRLMRLVCEPTDRIDRPRAGEAYARQG